MPVVTTNASNSMLELRQVTRVYSQGDRVVHALRDVDFNVEPGERVVIMGPSGSGKSTLLHLVAGLDRPTKGAVLFENQDLASLDEAGRAVLRRNAIGFVFQLFNLLPELTALENVRLPLDLAGISRDIARHRALERLAEVDLLLRRDHFSEHLSGGEMQRVAIARALVADPRLVLADEPTGNLDSESGSNVLDLLMRATGSKRALIMVTHDPRASRIATRVCHLRDGRLESS